MPTLDGLPTELLIYLPDFLYSLDDLYSLIRTCRTFYRCCRDSQAALRPLFARRYGQPLFPPHPHLLIAGTARSVADWAIKSSRREARLQRALKGGIDGLYELCCVEGRMSLTQARALTAAKYDLLNPLSELVDAAIGPVWREERYTKEGRSLDDDTTWWTICEYPHFALLNHWIYCELFHHNVDAASNPAVLPRTLALKTRVFFCSYCLPDCNNNFGQVPEEIFEQVYSYSSGPWDTSKHSTRLGCYMMIQELLYKEPNSPLHDLTIAGLVKEILDPFESALSGDTATLGLHPSQHQELCNITSHKPLLLFRLLLQKRPEETTVELRALSDQSGHTKTNGVTSSLATDVKDTGEESGPESTSDDSNDGTDDARSDTANDEHSPFQWQGGDEYFWQWESLSRDIAQIIWE